MGRMQRSKGARGEREAAKELARLFRCEAHRGRQYHGGDDSPDVKCNIPGIHFEVKRTERISIYAAMDQAIVDAGELLPVTLHRQNNRPWLLIVRLDDSPRLAEILFHQLAATI